MAVQFQEYVVYLEHKRYNNAIRTGNVQVAVSALYLCVMLYIINESAIVETRVFAC